MTADLRAALVVFVLLILACWLASAIGTWLTGVPG